MASPHNDWQLSWKMCRMRGLNSEMISFNFKLLHRLLPVRDRLHQITPATSPTCTLCTDSCPETLQHALLSCTYNGGTGQVLLSTLQRFFPALTPEKILLLQFPDVTELQEMSSAFLNAALNAALLLEVWNKRTKKTRISLFDIRSTLEAKVSLLRETRNKNFERFNCSYVNTVC